MRLLILLLAVIALTGAQLPGQAALANAPDGASEAVPLKLKIHRNWSIRLPAEQWRPVGTGFELNGIGQTFRAHLDGRALAVDSDADGNVDVRIEGEGGHLVLQSGDHRYAVRVKRVNGEWCFAPAGAMRGSIAGTRVRIIDQNNNGRFGDVGEDALVVGKGKVASLLSRVVSIDGQLFSIDVAADGSRLDVAPYTGEVATLDVSATTKGKVLAAVVTSADGQFSFGFSARDQALQVPVGDYTLHSGIIALGGNTVRIKAGRSKPVALTKGSRAALAFGGPVRAEFTYRRVGRELTFDPNAIWFYGANGEEYYGWNPLGKSPKISLHVKSGREIAQAYFPGSC